MSRLAKFAAWGLFWSIVLVAIQFAVVIIFSFVLLWKRVDASMQSDFLCGIAGLGLFVIPGSIIGFRMVKAYWAMASGRPTNSNPLGVFPILVGVVLWPIGAFVTYSAIENSSDRHYLPLGVSWLICGLMLSSCGLLVMILHKEYRGTR